MHDFQSEVKDEVERGDKENDEAGDERVAMSKVESTIKISGGNVLIGMNFLIGRWQRETRRLCDVVVRDCNGIILGFFWREGEERERWCVCVISLIFSRFMFHR